MTQAKTASEKLPKVERKDNVLDASKFEAVKVDAPKTEVGSNNKPATVTAVAS
jgi:hypothetical protein